MVAGKKKKIENPFLDNSFLFSHLIFLIAFIIYQYFLLDGAAERQVLKVST